MEHIWREKIVSLAHWVLTRGLKRKKKCANATVKYWDSCCRLWRVFVPCRKQAGTGLGPALPGLRALTRWQHLQGTGRLPEQHRGTTSAFQATARNPQASNPLATLPW